MADYYTNFSCIFDTGSLKNTQKALKIYEKDIQDKDYENFSEVFSISLDKNGKELWIRSEETGCPQAVADFIILCAHKMKLKGLWGFSYANTCSKPRIDGFSGGAIIIDLKEKKIHSFMDTESWLSQNKLV